VRRVTEDELSAAVRLWSTTSSTGYAGYLRTGLWKVAWIQESGDRFPAPVFARRDSVDVPQRFTNSLFSTAGESKDDRSATWTEFAIDRVPSDLDETFRADVWARRRGKSLLIDLVGHQVMHVHEAELIPEYGAFRRTFGAHLPTVDFAQLGSRRILEDFAVGVSLSAVAESARLLHVRDLLDGLARLIHATSAPVERFGRENLDRLLQRSPIREARERREEILDMYGYRNPVPGVVSHGDLKTHNLIATDGGLTVIDLDGLEIRPFWSDALYAARKLAPKALRDGRLDSALGGVFDAAGVAINSSVLEWARLAELSQQAIKAHKKLSQAGRFSRAVRGRRLSEEIRSNWIAKQRGLSPVD